MHIFPALISAIAIMAMSLIGILASWGALGNWLGRKMHYLTSFAAGIFVVVSIDLIVESNQVASYTETAFWIVVGFLLFFLAGRVIPGTHAHHDSTHEHEPKSTRKILVADAFHNTVDGIILASAFLVSVQTGVVVSIGILVHEVIQEVSEFFVLRQAGYTTRQALVRNFIVSGTILIGVGIGFSLSNVSGILPILLGLAAGAFLHVIFVDLLPHQLKVCTEPYCVRKHIAWALLGLVVMLGINEITSGLHNNIEPAAAQEIHFTTK